MDPLLTVMGKCKKSKEAGCTAKFSRLTSPAKMDSFSWSLSSATMNRPKYRFSSDVTRPSNIAERERFGLPVDDRDREEGGEAGVSSTQQTRRTSTNEAKRADECV